MFPRRLMTRFADKRPDGGANKRLIFHLQSRQAVTSIYHDDEEKDSLLSPAPSGQNRNTLKHDGIKPAGMKMQKFHSSKVPNLNKDGNRQQQEQTQK